MPITKIRGVNINYQVIGERGPWIMLTTGGRRGHEEFIPLAKKLAARGHRVVLHDRRNTGASDVLIEGAEGEEVIWTEDMRELMQNLGALPAFCVFYLMRALEESERWLSAVRERRWEAVEGECAPTAPNEKRPFTLATLFRSPEAFAIGFHRSRAHATT